MNNAIAATHDETAPASATRDERTHRRYQAPIFCSPPGAKRTMREWARRAAQPRSGRRSIV